MAGFLGIGGGSSPQFSGDMANAGGDTAAATNEWGDLSGEGQSSFNNFGQDNSNYRNTGNQLAQMDMQTPTAQQQTAMIAPQAVDAAGIYAKARASLAASAANRGIDTASDVGSQSSEMAGGEASLAGGQANADASAYQNMYNTMLSPEAQAQRLGQANNIYGQMSGQDWNQGLDATKTAGSGYQDAANEWGNMGEEQSREDQANNAVTNGIWGGIGKGVGAYIGGVGFSGGGGGGSSGNGSGGDSNAGDAVGMSGESGRPWWAPLVNDD